VKRLRDAGYEKTLADRVEQWWLWTSGGEHPHLGWSHFDFDLHALAGKGETRIRFPGGSVKRITEEFSYRDSDGRYRDDVKVNESNGEEAGAAYQQITSATAEQVSVGFHLANSTVTSAKSPTPANYIPGALLPLVLGKLKPTPMLIRTESFPGGWEAVGPAELLSVLIRPDETATTRKADGESGPMRCVTAQVNGSGEITRWYFRQSGELECIELSGGVRRVPADEASIGFDFGNTPRMKP